ncbi:hypothetical protein L1987_40315 [Smallanthus sonchifolius]|uniref:Uncharacterized protein n=1 Tax=Smallanthus sonchifolius TaxID=185202 RepID=A0ACB9GTR7_9ASTR|nr:hypothetical protein L1987_40315 [Smallanthus sonchifolius]
MIQRLKQQVQVDVVQSMPFPIFLHFLGLQNIDDGATTTASSVVAPSSYASLDLHMQNKIFGLIYTQEACADLGKKTADFDAEFGLIKKLHWLLRNWYENDTPVSDFLPILSFINLLKANLIDSS